MLRLRDRAGIQNYGRNSRGFRPATNRRTFRRTARSSRTCPQRIPPPSGEGGPVQLSMTPTRKRPRALNGTLRRRLVRPFVVAPPLAPTSFANLIDGDYVAKKTRPPDPFLEHPHPRWWGSRGISGPGVLCVLGLAGLARMVRLEEMKSKFFVYLLDARNSFVRPRPAWGRNCCGLGVRMNVENALYPPWATSSVVALWPCGCIAGIHFFRTFPPL